MNDELGTNHQITQLKHTPRPHILIPLIVTYPNFIQIKTDELPSALQNFSEQIKDLLSFESALHGCTCMRTKFWIQSINIKTDEYFFRQLLHDLVGNLFPAFAFKLAFFDSLIEISCDP